MNIGFIGLGAMGELIVPRLMAAGHAVTGWNRSRAKAEPLIKAGMRFAESPRAVAENAEIVFSIVTDAAAVRAVALGEDGIIAGLAQRRHLHRHEHDRARREPRGRRRIRPRRLDHARWPALGKPGDGEGRPGLDHDRRRRSGVRARQARAAGDRPQGHPHRRQRTRLPDEDRGQSAADGGSDRIRRGHCARREGRRRARGRRRCRAQERRGFAGAWLSRTVHPRRQDAGRAARRCHAAAEGHAACARSRPQARKPRPARRRGQRNDERLPRARASMPTTSWSRTKSIAAWEDNHDIDG